MSNSSLNRSGANAVGASFILWALIIAMLIFTSIRTVHLLQLTFSVQDKYVAYLGLAAFDVGVLGWFYYATAKARGAAQRAVAYGMIFVCAAGVVLATIADFFYQADANGVTKLPPQMVTIAIWGVIIVVVLNFLAGILAHLVDPKHIQHMKEEQLHDTIIAASHSHMEKMTNQIAPQIAAVLAVEWRDRITAELLGKLPQGTVQGSGQALPLSSPESAEVSLAQTASVPAPQPTQAPPQPEPAQPVTGPLNMDLLFAAFQAGQQAAQQQNEQPAASAPAQPPLQGSASQDPTAAPLTTDQASQPSQNGTHPKQLPPMK